VNRLKTPLFLLVLSAFAAGCDSDEPNSPPSPRLVLQGPIALEVDDDETESFISIGREVSADATGSFDLQGEEFELAFELEAPEGSDAALVLGSDGETATVTPDIAGDYTITLTATDFSGQVAAQALAFTARENAAPTAALTADEFGVVGLPTQLDATGSEDGDDGFEPDDELTFSWRVELPEGADPAIAESIEAATTPTVTITPSVVGDYKVFVKANDRFDDSEEVSITVPVRSNRGPVADVVRSESGTVGERVDLDGSASFDPDEDELSIKWELFAPDGTNASDTLVDADTLKPSFVPAQEGSYRAVLTLSDGFAPDATDAVLIDVKSGTDEPGGSAVAYPDFRHNP